MRVENEAIADTSQKPSQKALVEREGEREKKEKGFNEKNFSKIALENEFCDPGYLDKTLEQIPRCKKEDIENIARKTEVMENCIRGRKFGKARVIFHEIAGLVNDSQQQKLSNV